MKISERCHYDQFLSALSSESRLALLERLTGREMTVTELTELMGMSQSAVSHHLAALRWAGLVKIRREGRWTFYVADTDCLAVCCRRLFEQLNVKVPRLKE
jgi:ArsR family transcriptional regulator